MKKENEMRTFAHHDANGNVRALITINGGKMAMLTPKAGQFVTEVDPVEMDPRKMDIAAVRKMTKKMKIPPPQFFSAKEQS
jgi:hypothetical protein